MIFERPMSFASPPRTRHEPLRSQLLHRGNELANRAADDLLSFPRPDTARSLSILMTELVRDSFFRCRTPHAAAARGRI